MNCSHASSLGGVTHSVKSAVHPDTLRRHDPTDAYEETAYAPRTMDQYSASMRNTTKVLMSKVLKMSCFLLKNNNILMNNFLVLQR